MDTHLALSLRNDVTLGEENAGQLVVRAPGNGSQPVHFPLKQVTPGLAQALRRLRSPVTLDELTAAAMEGDGPAAVYKLDYYLRGLGRAGLLCHTVVVDDCALATIVPLTSRYQYQDKPVDRSRKHVLSRFAYLRKNGNGLVLETPLGYAQIEVHDGRVAALVAELAQPRTCRELSLAVSGLSEDAVALCLNLLLNVHAATEVLPDGTLPEESDDALAQWEFHDLVFHSRSRLGRHNNPWGKTYRFTQRIPPLPPVKPPMAGDPIPLYAPDLQVLAQSDPPFTQVLEGRKSVRSYGAEAITLAQLGEFLYRVARVKQIFYDDKGGVTFRNYPGGGALHALEIYPVIDRCDGLAPGLYHYEPLAHQLSRVAELTPATASLLEMARLMIQQETRPQVLFEIAARFQRVQWKYSSIAYSVILKDLGGLYQTMYLVATAMGLAPCALGGGHADLFATAASLNYYAETTVGAFVLGTCGDPQGASPVE